MLLSYFMKQNFKRCLTFLFEREVFCEMPAFVVATKEEECIGIQDFQCPQVQHTLKMKHRYVKKNLEMVTMIFPPIS